MLLLTFRATDGLYAVDAGRVREVVPRVPLRSVPHGSAALAGMFDYRGRVVPVVEIGLLLGSAPCRARLSTRIVVVADSGGDLLGLVAEEVLDVRPVADDGDAFAPRPPDSPAYFGAIARLGDGLVQLIDVDYLLPGPTRPTHPHAGAH